MKPEGAKKLAVVPVTLPVANDHVAAWHRHHAPLGAIEHLTSHEGRSLDIVTTRVREVCERAGVDWKTS